MRDSVARVTSETDIQHTAMEQMAGFGNRPSRKYSVQYSTSTYAYARGFTPSLVSRTWWDQLEYSNHRNGKNWKFINVQSILRLGLRRALEGFPPRSHPIQVTTWVACLAVARRETFFVHQTSSRRLSLLKPDATRAVEISARSFNCSR